MTSSSFLAASLSSSRGVSHSGAHGKPSRAGLQAFNQTCVPIPVQILQPALIAARQTRWQAFGTDDKRLSPGNSTQSRSVSGRLEPAGDLSATPPLILAPYLVGLDNQQPENSLDHLRQQWMIRREVPMRSSKTLLQALGFFSASGAFAAESDLSRPRKSSTRKSSIRRWLLPGPGRILVANIHRERAVQPRRPTPRFLL